MKPFRRLLPKGLFARALLIVVLPTVLVQMVTAYIFYTRHWENVTRHMANSLAGEIAFLAYQATSAKRQDHETLAWIFEQTTGITSSFAGGARLTSKRKRADFPEFESILAKRIDLPFEVSRLPDGDNLAIRVQLADGVLTLEATVKRLENPTTSIFMLWVSGSSLVFLLIAIIFLKNQVRPIRELALAAESFGKGRDHAGFKPAGALEVRQAARAFLEMRERIQRQIRTRTDMLAGISHDLRTPLTRMKLELALLPDSPEVRELGDDVAQMERMVAEYLDFARGAGGEEAQRVDVAALLSDIREDYRRTGRDFALTAQAGVCAALRPVAFRRVLHNIIDNALRYGKELAVAAHTEGEMLTIIADDHGPGIPKAQREEVFRPFTRLEASRNQSTGGVGLGLTIARDIAQSHGGDIALGESPAGGLRVIIRLPL